MANPNLDTMGTRRCSDIESTSLTLIQRRHDVVCAEAEWGTVPCDIHLKKLC